MKAYKTDLNEQNIQPLSDDYLKFIRLSEHFIEKNKSEITVYDFKDHHLQNEQKITTPGRAYDVFNVDKRWK